MAKIIAAVVLLMLLAACSTAHPHAQPVLTVTRTIVKTVKVPVPGPTVTGRVPAQVPCSIVNSGFLVIGQPGGNSTPDGTCQVALYGNSGNGSVKLTDSSGRVTWYTLGIPSASSAQAPAAAPSTPSINGATWSVTVDCTTQQCTTLPGAGPGGSTCGQPVNNRQVCVGTGPKP